MPKILGNTQNAHISMAGGVKKVRLVRLYWRDFAGMSSQRGECHGSHGSTVVQLNLVEEKIQSLNLRWWGEQL